MGSRHGGHGADRAHLHRTVSMTEDEVAVTVPHGWWVDGVRVQEVSLRPLSGSEELFLIESSGSLAPASVASGLLSRCVTALGASVRVSLDCLRGLTVGDWDALVLHLCEGLEGDHLPIVLRCPNEDCGERLDLDLRVRDLLVPPYPSAAPTYERTFPEDGNAYRVRFRLVQGGDLAAVAALGRPDIETASEVLLRRSIVSVEREGGMRTASEDPPTLVRQELAATLAALDPQADPALSLTCPSCDTRFRSLFDPSVYLQQELTGQASAFFREVHLLASWYHWAETDILGMVRTRRRRYADQISDAVSEARRE